MIDTELETNQKMLQLASQLKAGKGLTLVVSLVIGDLCNGDDRLIAEKFTQVLKA